MKKHKPFFIYIVTGIQIFMMLISFYKYYMATGSLIAPITTNIMLGPDAGTLIQLGSRFVPCMKKTNHTYVECPPSIKYSEYYNNKDYCSFADICGFGLEEGETPNQWFRFFTAIFLHGGIIHLILNLIFQIRTGVQMEKDFGTWRIMIIYLASGIFGFVFGGPYAGVSNSVGCSGSLYGLLACLLLDLIENWKIIVKPKKDLIKLIIVIIISLGFGLIPNIDNFSHVGGFITGILTGLIFMPSIIFSKKDLKIKRILMLISIFILVFMYIMVFEQFYAKTKKCSWCHYINCLPLKNNWCLSYDA
ncbi:rhomboid-domain-containing protein [Anaeromyces robustus]|uniref:Rhomboid-type serine protease n=1 Tax=Anaeromyces robustus TaxID=1754192 RepID=A0A1Y1WTN3_9FUNG|nr:rhomboid-domain-containing protein [Anaeromyces robustus]|eukprot:ORX76910.1 rhomboid-domain-containing protein [Anaeromyces robustus]